MSYIIYGVTVVLMILAIIFSAKYTSMYVEIGLFLLKRPTKTVTKLNQADDIALSSLHRRKNIANALYHIFAFVSVLLPAIHLSTLHVENILFIFFTLSVVAFYFAKDAFDEKAIIKQFSFVNDKRRLPLDDSPRGDKTLQEAAYQHYHKELRSYKRDVTFSGSCFFIISLLYCPLLNLILG